MNVNTVPATLYPAGRLRSLADITLPSPPGSPAPPPQKPIPDEPRVPEPPRTPVPGEPKVPEPPKTPAPPAGPQLPLLGRALTRLPAPVAGAIFGVGWFGLPMAAGIMGGVTGALVGGVASLGFQYALDRNARRALMFAAGPTALAAGIPPHSWSALGVAGVVALSAALGAALTWGGKFEDWLEPR